MLNAEAADNKNLNVASTVSTQANESSANVEPEDKWLFKICQVQYSGKKEVLALLFGGRITGNAMVPCKKDCKRVLQLSNCIVIIAASVHIRQCEVYKSEYKECTSFRGRFQQYFVYGEPQDCNQWKKDYDNCCKWEDDKDLKAAEALIESERKRRLERLKAHYRNDTWKKRESPPADWDKPLPEWMSKRDENTYLAQKAKEMREGISEKDNNGFCAIM